MGAILTERRVDKPLAARLHPVGTDEIVIDWLGQAGFLLRTGARRVLIDPYLSDSLADKYRGSATPHERLMPPPVTPERLGKIDLVLVTHQHTDHMDPGTLAPLAAADPDVRFVIARASRDEARRRIAVAEDRLVPVDAGETVTPLPGLRVSALRAAHEALERDAEGHHRFLGYALTVETSDEAAGRLSLFHAEEPALRASRSMHGDPERGASFDTAAPRPAQDEGRWGSGDAEKGGITIVHTGDTVPFDGQVAEIAAHKPDLLLLPVNGRSPVLAARGIAGNLTLDEAVALTAAVGAPAMVAHHHGMFAFNTLPLDAIEAKAADPALPIRLIPARTGLELRLRPA